MHGVGDTAPHRGTTLGIVPHSSCVRFSFFSIMPRDWLGRTSPKGTIFVEWDAQSINKTSQHVLFFSVYTDKQLCLQYVERSSFTSVGSLFHMLAVRQHKSSIADSSTCPLCDEVTTRRGTQCSWCRYIGSWCQKVRDVLRPVSMKRLVN